MYSRKVLELRKLAGGARDMAEEETIGLRNRLVRFSPMHLAVEIGIFFFF